MNSKNRYFNLTKINTLFSEHEIMVLLFNMTKAVYPVKLANMKFKFTMIEYKTMYELIGKLINIFIRK